MPQGIVYPLEYQDPYTFPHNEAVFMADGSGPVLGLRAAAEYAAACRQVFANLTEVTDADRVKPTPLTDPELRGLYSKVLERLA